MHIMALCMMLMVTLKRGDLRTILGLQACQKNGVRESLPVSAAFRGVQECSSKAAGSKEEPSSPYKAFKLVSPKDGFDTQEEEALPPLTRPLKKSAATALEDPPPTAAAAGPSPRPDAAGESENPKNAGMDSSMLPNAARSYKDTTGNWEAGFLGNNWMVFVTLFVFTISLSLSLSSTLTLSQLGRCLSSCDRQGT